jgi:hypothetical protein
MSYAGFNPLTFTEHGAQCPGILSRAREAGEIVVEIAHNKQATKSDAIRLQACREILDRGMGKAPQSLSLSLERAWTNR